MNIIDPSLPIVRGRQHAAFLPKTLDIAPSFAREASRLLLDGDVQQAIDLCVRGTTTFPAYSTGYLVLGKCYEAAGQNSMALGAYRQALALLPDSPTLLELVGRGEVEERRRQLKRREEEQARESRKSENPTAEPEASTLRVVDPPSGRQGSVQPESAAPPSIDEEESTLDYLARRLQNVKRIRPDPVSDPETKSSRAGTQGNGGFVTATIAEIYVGQGEYEEAIAAYIELIRQHPHEEKYKRRLVEIEQLMRLDEKG